MAMHGFVTVVDWLGLALQQVRAHLFLRLCLAQLNLQL